MIEKLIALLIIEIAGFSLLILIAVCSILRKLETYDEESDE